MTYQRRPTVTGVTYNRPSIMAHRPPVRPILPPRQTIPVSIGISRQRGLGNLGQITGNPTIDGIIENPFFLIGGGLLAWFLISRAISGKPRRRSKGISLLTVATLAAGAGAAGYLWGNGTLNQL
jgi:hypothetical protein